MRNESPQGSTASWMPWLCSQRATLTPSSPWRRPNFPSHPNVSPNASRKRGSYFEKGNCIGHALCSPVQPHADSKTRLRNRYVHAIRTMPPCTGLHTQRLSSPQNKAPRNAVGRTRGRWSGTVHRQKSARNRTSEGWGYAGSKPAGTSNTTNMLVDRSCICSRLLNHSQPDGVVPRNSIYL